AGRSPSACATARCACGTPRRQRNRPSWRATPWPSPTSSSHRPGANWSRALPTAPSNCGTPPRANGRRTCRPAARSTRLRRHRRTRPHPPQHDGRLLVLSADGSTLAAAGPDGVVRVWDLDSRKEKARLLTRIPVHALALSPDGEVLASDSAGGLTLKEMTP